MPVHGLSVYCWKHHGNSLRLGSPTQKRLHRVRDLAPYTKLVGRVLKVNRDHPAIKMVVSEFEIMLADAVGIAAANPAPRPLDWKGRMANELRRLHSHGVTGTDMLRACASVYFYAESNSRHLEPLSRAYQFALARSVLLLAPLESVQYTSPSSGRLYRSSKRMSTQVMANLGKTLAVMLVHLLPAMSNALERQANISRDRRARLVAALQQQPIV
jgi:hypothetical protein